MRTPKICTDGEDIRYCPNGVHHQHEDGRWVHGREAAATIMIDGPVCDLAPDGWWGPYTTRELGYMGIAPDGTRGDEMRVQHHHLQPGYHGPRPEGEIERLFDGANPAGHAERGAD